MKPATIHQIKKELQIKSKDELLTICLRLGKFKIDNKSLMSYILFHSSNEAEYVSEIKMELAYQMEEVEPYRIYIAKKNIRRILRNLNKQIKYSGNKETEVELRITFCELFRKLKGPIHVSRTMNNLYAGQVKKILAVKNKLHADLQYDYADRIKEL